MVTGLSQLERSYTAMARALDTTRHDLTLKGILPVDEGMGTLLLTREGLSKITSCELVLSMADNCFHFESLFVC